MPKFSAAKGATSVIARVFIQDTTKTDGSGLTGLVFNTAGLTCYQMRDDDGNAGGTAVALVTATRGTWTSKGFVEKDATNCPGWYEFGVPNAALLTGSRTADFHFKGATNMAALPVEIELTGPDNQNATTGGLGNLDAAVSSRSTYAGGDTSGTTTLLARVPGVVQPQTGDAFAALGAGVTVAAAGLNNVLVAGRTLPDALRRIGAVACGNSTGTGTGTESYQDFNGVVAVVTTFDASNNRTETYP